MRRKAESPSREWKYRGVTCRLIHITLPFSGKAWYCGYVHHELSNINPEALEFHRPITFVKTSVLGWDGMDDREFSEAEAVRITEDLADCLLAAAT